MSPSCLDQAPAVQMTVSVSMVPRLVSTAVTVAPSVKMSVTATAPEQAGAGTSGAPGISEDDGLRGAVPVLRRPSGSQQP